MLILHYKKRYVIKAYKVMVTVIKFIEEGCVEWLRDMKKHSWTPEQHYLCITVKTQGTDALFKLSDICNYQQLSNTFQTEIWNQMNLAFIAIMTITK